MSFWNKNSWSVLKKAKLILLWLYCWFQKKVVRIIRTLSNIKCICYLGGFCWKLCDSLLPTTLCQTQTRNTNPTCYQIPIISISYQNNIDFLVGGWTNPSEKIGSTYKLDHFPKSFGVNIPKNCELPSPSQPSHDLPMHLSIWALISLILRILNLAWHSNVVCCSAAAKAMWDVASSNGWWVKGCVQLVPSDEFLTTALARHSAKQMATYMPFVGRCDLCERHFRIWNQEANVPYKDQLEVLVGAYQKTGTLNPLIFCWDESFPRDYLFFVGGSIKFETHGFRWTMIHAGVVQGTGHTQYLLMLPFNPVFRVNPYIASLLGGSSHLVSD